MKTETLPDGTQKGYFFRPEGVLHHSVDANGTQVTYGYDNALRMIHKDIQRGVGVEGVTSEDYWYDGANRMTSAQNDYSTVTRKYNSYSEVYEETSAVTINGATQTKTVNSEFDRLGNRTALIYPSGKKLNYTRDEMDRTKNILDEYGKPIAQYTYNGYRMKQRKSGNGTLLDIAYDAMRRITSYNNTKTAVPSNGTQEIAGFEYGYNKEGMRTYENYTPGDGETSQQARGKVFAYDSLYQITGVKYDVPDPIAEIQSPGTQPFSKQVAYNFDNSGNRNTVETRHGVSLPETQNYQSNSLNQYTTIDSSVFGYDSVGNMTTGIIYLDDMQNPGQKTPALARFIYDYQNNLVRAEQVSDNSVLGEYIYDVLGRRAYKNAWDRESTAYQATYFWYNGVECIEETDTTGTAIAVYTFGIGIDEAISVKYPQTSEQYPQSGTYWYHADVLGSVVAITDSDGAVIERYKYDIYGEATVLAPDGETLRAESQLGNRILYTGREYDKETGLYYYRARYYHAQIGRFISADPIGSDGFESLFAYVNNNSVNYKDSNGLEPEADAMQNALAEIQKAKAALESMNLKDSFNYEFLTQGENNLKAGNVKLLSSELKARIISIKINAGVVKRLGNCWNELNAQKYNIEDLNKPKTPMGKLVGFGGALYSAYETINTVKQIYKEESLRVRIEMGADWVINEAASTAGRYAGAKLGLIVGAPIGGFFAGPPGAAVVGFLFAVAGAIAGPEAVEEIKEDALEFYTNKNIEAIDSRGNPAKASLEDMYNGEAGATVDDGFGNKVRVCFIKALK